MAGPSRGVWVSSADADLVRTVAGLGFDWLVLDAQHGAIDRAALLEVGRALTDAGATFGVRVPELDFAWVGAALDAGATTVIVPQVDSAEEARRAAEACRYPPQGRRSWGQFAALRGVAATDPASANAAVTCAVMIESAAALAAVEEIAAVPGLDMLFVGPFDLSLSLGVGVDTIADPGGPLTVIAAAAHRHDLVLGAFAGDVERAAPFRAAGVQYLAVTTEQALLRHGATAVLAITADETVSGGSIT